MEILPVGSDPARVVPAEVVRLAPRMRQIATAIYSRGGATVREIQADIVDPPSVFALRTMIKRLEKKRIISSRRSGRHSEVLYLPAILNDGVRECALRSFVDREFDGSLQNALQMTLQIMGR